MDEPLDQTTRDIVGYLRHQTQERVPTGSCLVSVERLLHAAEQILHWRERALEAEQRIAGLRTPGGGEP